MSNDNIGGEKRWLQIKLHVAKNAGQIFMLSNGCSPTACPKTPQECVNPTLGVHYEYVLPHANSWHSFDLHAILNFAEWSGMTPTVLTAPVHKVQVFINFIIMTSQYIWNTEARVWKVVTVRCVWVLYKKANWVSAHVLHAGICHAHLCLDCVAVVCCLSGWTRAHM